jgi:hypothetical protein
MGLLCQPLVPHHGFTFKFDDSRDGPWGNCQVLCRRPLDSVRLRNGALPGKSGKSLHRDSERCKQNNQKRISFHAAASCN